MPRWLWFAPLAALVAALAVWGFRLGWIAATITETDVIEAWTAHYLAHEGPGALVTDCTAQPGTDDRVWILVSCVPQSGARVDYPVDRLGRLLRVVPVGPQPATPET